MTRYFTSFIPVYNSCATNIQRVDIFRIIAVYAIGGFYLDLDVECFNRLDDLCDFHCVFGEEVTLTKEMTEKIGHRNPVRVANYMFGSKPGHPFLLHLLLKMAEESHRKIKTEDDVLESSGPGLVTNVYFDYKDKFKDIVLLPNKDRICSYCRNISCHFGNYAKHHHAASWRWKNAHNNLYNRPQEKGNVTQQQLKKINYKIESEIKKISLPNSIHILKTYKERCHDGLTTVFHSTRNIGILEDDTRHLTNKKVLISGIPFLYLDRISQQNTNVIYTTFESTKLPDFWVEAINKYYHYCIVPHRHIKNVFKRSGVHIPIEVIHQGFTRYKRIYRNMTITNIFRVGFLGIPVRRKNLFKLYQACSNLFGKIPGLKLVVHVSQYYDWMDKSGIELIKSAPFVEWSEGYLPDDEIARWYSNLSCLVFPSSGEGWSFTPRESLYLGIPTILTDIPVHHELIESGYYKVIPVKGLELAEFEGNIFGKWHKVDVEDIENSILDLYQHYGNFLIQSLKGSQWIENKWTNESSQQSIFNFFSTI